VKFERRGDDPKSGCSRRADWIDRSAGKPDGGNHLQIQKTLKRSCVVRISATIITFLAHSNLNLTSLGVNIAKEAKTQWAEECILQHGQ
jgi:hypothetical protein